MGAIFDTVLPFFALILCGYAAGRLRLLNGPMTAGVNGFVFYFALPALLFSLTSTAPLAELVSVGYVAAYLSAGLSVFCFAAVLGLAVFKIGRGEAALLGAAAVFPNTGYMGVPLVAAALGNEAAIAVVVGLTLEVTVLVPLTMAVIEAEGGGGRWSTLLRRVVSSLVRNPIVVSIFAGSAVSLSGAPLPAAASSFAETLGAAAGPCALFALGATLLGTSVAAGLPEASYATTLKLLLHPAAMWLATTRIFDVDPLWATAATLAAALPVAATVFVVARQYDTYVERVSAAILLSTVASVLTVSLLLTTLSPA